MASAITKQVNLVIGPVGLPARHGAVLLLRMKSFGSHANNANNANIGRRVGHKTLVSSHLFFDAPATLLAPLEFVIRVQTSLHDCSATELGFKTQK